MALSIQELNLGLIIEHNQSQVQVFAAKIAIYIGLCLFFTIYVPKYLPLLEVSYDCHKLSIFYFWSSLFTLSLLIYVTCVFIVTYKLFTVLCSINSLNKLSTYSIHKGTIISGSYLPNMKFGNLIFVKRYFINQYVPRAPNYFFEFISDLHKLFKMRVSLIAYKLIFLWNGHLLLFFLLLTPFSQLP